MYVMLCYVMLYLSSKLSKRSDTHHHVQHEEKRQSKSPTMQNSYRATVILHRAVSAWNSLAADIRNHLSLCTFKRSVKRELRGKTPYVK